MNKKDFINCFKFEDKDALALLYDKISIADKVTYPLYTNEFYPPSVWNTLNNINMISNMNITLLGGFEEAERKVIAFNHESYYDMPFVILNIKCRSKFHKLSHRDFLGAIISLGIIREKFGDLMVNDNEAFITVIREVAQYIIDNLTSISNAPCTVSEVNDYTELPKIDFQDLNIISTSLRVDCVVSAITKLSRGNCEKALKEGKVLVNYSQVNDKSKELALGDTITVRGYGKFKLSSILGSTSSGRIKLNVKKYN